VTLPVQVAIYALVSTSNNKQDTEREFRQLRAFAEQYGTIYKVYADQESVGKTHCIGFKYLLRAAYQKEFNLVVFWSLNRFSSGGALATLRHLKDLNAHGVNYKSYTEPYLDSLSPCGDVIAAILSTIVAQDFSKLSKNTKATLPK
jgi:DNA invertase Pin-like site-specific DNA recombinase